MSIDVFEMECDALDGVKLAGFKGTEHLNRPFEFDVFFTVPVGTDVRGAVGSRATLTADRDDGRGPMCWQGILAGARLLHETAERALYRASLVPKVWLLGQYVRSFVHTKKKVDAYVADTLKDGGLSGGDFEFKTNGTYPQEEFVCQYRESHLDFVHRWFEREGLYYYFEHPEGAGAAEKMVIADDKAQHGPLLGDGHVRYFPAAGMDGSAGECLRELHADFRMLPASVLVTDYNYANPAAPVEGEKPVMSGGKGKIREYGYRVFTEGEAKRLAQVKAQSIACRELVLSASGTYLGLRAGYTFEVDEGPSDLPSKYLAIEVRHAGVVSGAPSIVMRYTGLDGKETYRVDVTAIPANVQYRAPQSTPWPRIYGFENGTVDGPGESQYAQIDDQGRYLVRFKFDASELPDGSTSTYLRMMQPHGGGVEGWHFPLRKGTEVMVGFQGGDPDRPVIAGVVPNAVTPSPVTRANQTRNVIQTGGRNRIEIEDKAGYERISLSTPHQDSYLRFGAPNDDHTMIIHTDGPTLLDAGHDLDVIVGGEKHETVARKVIEEYKATKTEKVPSGQVTETYLAQETTVKNLRKETLGQQKTIVEGGRHETVVGPVEQVFGSVTQRTYGSTVDEKYVGTTSRKYAGNVFETYQSDFSTTIHGSHDTTITGAAKYLNADAHVMYTLGATSDTYVGVKNETCIVVKMEAVIGAKLSSVVGVQIDLNASATIKAGGAPEIVLRSALLESISTGISNWAAAKLENAGVAIERAGTTLID